MTRGDGAEKGAVVKVFRVFAGVEAAHAKVDRVGPGAYGRFQRRGGAGGR